MKYLVWVQDYLCPHPPNSGEGTESEFRMFLETVNTHPSPPHLFIPSPLAPSVEIWFWSAWGHWHIHSWSSEQLGGGLHLPCSPQLCLLALQYPSSYPEEEWRKRKRKRRKWKKDKRGERWRKIGRGVGWNRREEKREREEGNVEDGKRYIELETD